MSNSLLKIEDVKLQTQKMKRYQAFEGSFVTKVLIKFTNIKFSIELLYTVKNMTIYQHSKYDMTIYQHSKYDNIPFNCVNAVDVLINMRANQDMCVGFCVLRFCVLNHSPGRA